MHKEGAVDRFAVRFASEVIGSPIKWCTPKHGIAMSTNSQHAVYGKARSMSLDTRTKVLILNPSLI